MESQTDLILPNLIIAGAPKSGTSSVHFWLEAHPETLGSKRKDSCFLADRIFRFNENLSYLEDGLEGYASLFNSKLVEKKKIIFETTATYIFYDGTPEIVSKLPNNPRIMFILRNPLARLKSQYLFEKHRTKRVHDLSLREYLKEGENLKHGDYLLYLKKWESYIGKDRMLFYIFEDFMKDPENSMKDLCTKLGIDPEFYSGYDFTKRNETLKVKNSWLHQLGLKIQPMIPGKVQKALLPFYLKINTGGKPSLNQEEIKIFEEEVKPQFARAKAELEDYLGISIDSWN